MRLDQLRTQALRYLALGDFARALVVYERVLAALPDDLDTRMRVADVLAQIGQRELAQRVYAAVAFYDLQGGRALHGLVAIQALADLGHDVAPLKRALAQIYGAGSPKIARVGARLAPPPPDSEVAPPDLSRPLGSPPKDGGAVDPRSGLEEAALAAAGIAADTRSISQFPDQFPPVPLLSELSEAAFARVLGAATVHRLGHGTPIVRAGEAGDAFYFLAAGEARVFTVEADGREVELGRLHEGAIFGEMALVNAEPRSANVAVVGSADVIAVGRRALQAVADELPAVAAALDRFTRDRLLKNLLSTSPLFRPFSPQQRLDLVAKFSGHDVVPGREIIREGDEGRGLYLLLSGEVEVRRGQPPFDAHIATLHPGDCFGEISVLRGQPAMATVVATRRSSVLFLAREYFQRLIEALPAIRQMFEAMTAERLAAVAAAEERAGTADGDVDSRFLF